MSVREGGNVRKQSTDYLSGRTTTASAPALYVICRYLTLHADGVTSAWLRDALHPPGLTAEEEPGPDRQAPSVLEASLEVAQHLSLVSVTGAGDSRVFTLGDVWNDGTDVLTHDDSRRFRAFVLARLGKVALEDVRDGRRPTDLVRGLVQFLHRDPMRPLQLTWSSQGNAASSPEAFFKGQNEVAVPNQEQFRPFWRWALAFGLAWRTGSAAIHLVADPTSAIRAVLPTMPAEGGADEWLARLYEALPMLGHPDLLHVVLKSVPPPQSMLGSVELAIRRLEADGTLRLVPSADAINAVVLSQGGAEHRRISRIEVTMGSER